jgi:hypothetical protein
MQQCDPGRCCKEMTPQYTRKDSKCVHEGADELRDSTDVKRAEDTGRTAGRTGDQEEQKQVSVK